MRSSLSGLIRPVRHTSLLAACLTASLALSGCGDGDDAPAGDSTPSAAPSSTASSTAPADSVLTDEEAARAFFDAVVAGDRDAAAEVATPAAVAFFEPYDPSPDLTFSGPNAGVFFISPGAAPFQCTVRDGQVEECSDEPTGDEALTDEEAARAFFDAVVAGDRDAAAEVATPAAVAFFEPYDPSPDLTFSGPNAGVFFISPGAAPFQCTVRDGQVQECSDEPTGP